MSKLKINLDMIERDTPKKPDGAYVNGESRYEYYCPVCYDFIGESPMAGDFCSKCGQRIDWDEE